MYIFFSFHSRKSHLYQNRNLPFKYAAYASAPPQVWWTACRYSVTYWALKTCLCCPSSQCPSLRRVRLPPVGSNIHVCCWKPPMLVAPVAARCWAPAALMCSTTCCCCPLLVHPRKDNVSGWLSMSTSHISVELISHHQPEVIMFWLNLWLSSSIEIIDSLIRCLLKCVW